MGTKNQRIRAIINHTIFQLTVQLNAHRVPTVCTFRAYVD